MIDEVVHSIIDPVMSLLCKTMSSGHYRMLTLLTFSRQPNQQFSTQ